jgi:hypothetical protein
MVSAAWGNIPRADCVRVTSRVAEVVGGVNVHIDVTVLPHTVSCRLWPDRKTIPRGGGEVRAVSLISKPPSEIVEEHVKAAAQQAIRFASGLLREADPRIGQVVKEEEWGSFQRGSLFDPPRMRPPAWEKPRLDSVACSLCHSGFKKGAPAMWSGGNLLWTHPSCWLQTHDD